jgi:hypothetical protein
MSRNGMSSAGSERAPMFHDRSEEPVLRSMAQQLGEWNAAGDRKAVFLGCYTMMTKNMYTAADQGEFADAVWVRCLLKRFAEYYFDALRAFSTDPRLTVPVWKTAHEATKLPAVTPAQLLFLGVNAHINYDLVLAVEEVLAPEWQGLHSSQQAARYDDYCHVNDIISRTIDAVQDEVLTPAMPVMGVVDTMMGRMDEILISTLLTRWREEVWQRSLCLLEAGPGQRRSLLLQELDTHVMKRAEVLASPDWSIFRKLM